MPLHVHLRLTADEVDSHFQARLQFDAVREWMDRCLVGMQKKGPKDCTLRLEKVCDAWKQAFRELALQTWTHKFKEAGMSVPALHFSGDTVAVPAPVVDVPIFPVGPADTDITLQAMQDTDRHPVHR